MKLFELVGKRRELDLIFPLRIIKRLLFQSRIMLISIGDLSVINHPHAKWIVLSYNLLSRPNQDQKVSSYLIFVVSFSFERYWSQILRDFGNKNLSTFLKKKKRNNTFGRLHFGLNFEITRPNKSSPN